MFRAASGTDRIRHAWPAASGSAEGPLERLFRALLDPATSRTHYLAAAAVVGLWLILAWGLHPWLGDRGSFLIFIPAVLFAAGFGGLGPGLLATTLSVTLGVLLVGRGHLTQPALLETIIFASSASASPGSASSFASRAFAI
jgi:Domain of unknown function (DUF4118)